MNNKNFRLKIEFSNGLYNVFDEAIVYMKDKQNYIENDIVKLLSALRKGKYKYITNDEGYREQIEILDDFFKKEYNHLLLSFILIKKIINNRNDEFLSKIIKDKNAFEQVIYMCEKEYYDELMELVENDKTVFLAFCKLYEDRVLR